MREDINSLLSKIRLAETSEERTALLSEVLAAEGRGAEPMKLPLDDLEGVAGGVIDETNTEIMKRHIALLRDEVGCSKERFLAAVFRCMTDGNDTDYYGLSAFEVVELTERFW